MFFALCLNWFHLTLPPEISPTIFVGGAGARVKGLKAFLENEFSGVEIVILDMLPDAKISSSVSKSGINTSELIACLGAAEASLTFITASKEAKANKMILLGLLVLVVGFVGAVLLVIIGKGKLSGKQNERDKLQVKIQELEASGIEELESKYNKAIDAVGKITEFHEGTYRVNEEWNTILGEIETKTVDSLVVSTLSSDAKNVASWVWVSLNEMSTFLFSHGDGA